MKKYVFTFILMFLFITNVRAVNYVGHYECYNGGTLLNKSTFDVEMGSDLYWKCNQGFTNVNFYFTYYGGGTGPGGEGENATFSFVPSSPLGVDSGFDLYNTNNKCLVTANQIICPATTNSSGDFGFALFSNDKNSYWHILKKFNPANNEEISALTTFQAQQSLQNNTNNAINNSTNSITSNSNNNKNEIINNQNSQFNELKEKQDEANETSKGIWGTIKEIFQSIVSLPIKIFDFIKSIFIPEPKCHTSKNLFNKNSDFQLGYIDANNKFISANNNALFDYIEVKPNTTYTLSFKGSITGATSVLFYEDKSLIRRDSSRKTFNFTTTEDTKYIRLFFNFDGVTTMTQEVIDSLEIMLTEGEAIEPYEPFGEICEETSFFTWFQRLADIIGGFFSNLLNGILNGLKTLFIPADDYFSNYFNDLYSFFNDKLGILIYPLDLLLDTLNKFMNLNNNNSCNITIPNISIGGFGNLIQARNWNMCEFWSEDPYSQIRTIYITFVNAFVGFCLIRLAIKKEQEIVGGGNSDN